MSETILTSTGQYFDFTKPEAHDYQIEEIAHALSHLCRYTGHVSQFYSVAQHSVLVSLFIEPALALEGLLHDASEAYLGDVSSPLKALLPDYKAIEHKVEAAIASQYGLNLHHRHIKIADLRMLSTEKRILMPQTDNDHKHWPDYPPYHIWIRPMSPEEAKDFFLTRYQIVQQLRPRKEA